MRNEERATPLALRIAAAAMAACVLVPSHFWPRLADATAAGREDYAALRIRLAFDRTPVTAIAERLDAILPRETPVALAPPLVRNDALRQRLAEALYPRRVDQRAHDVLALGRDGSVRTPEPGALAPPDPPPPVESFGFDPAGLLASIGMLLGFGLALRAVVPALRPEGGDAFAVPVSLVAGAGAVGAIVYISTFAQFGVPWWSVRAAGLAGLAATAIAARPWRDPARHLRALRAAPETWVLVALLALLVAQMALLPVTGWDGRSVWLFRAKQIFFERTMALRDLLQADWEWSHPVYPLLVPGVMATFGGAGRVFNERMAALAVPVLWSGALGLFWCLVRERAGRFAGAAVTFALFFGLEGLAADVYMDGLVAVLLAALLLALADRQRRGVALIAAFVVSLVKLEGAVAAGLFLAARAAADLWRDRGRANFARVAALAAPLVLPLAHRAWLSAHQVTEFQANVGIAKTIGVLPERLPVVVRGIAEVLLRTASGQRAETQAMLRAGLAGLVVALVLLAARRARGEDRPLTNPTWRAALVGGAALTVLAVALVCAMPQEAAWLVTWTLDRLLLHPAVAFAMLPFL